MGLLTENGSLFEVPPPGDRLTTVTTSVPTAATSGAATKAVSWVLLTNVVFSLVAFQTIVELFTKLLPFTVKVNAGESASTFRGDSEVAIGTGLSMVNFRVFVIPPPGAEFLTFTKTVPAFATSESLMAVVI
jgi:hypothetical protein